jgi:hypothetical protein
MEGRRESDRFVLCSERIILECKRCGERLVLLGFEDDWFSEGRTAFGCECGEMLTFVDRLDEEALDTTALLRRLRGAREE